MRTGHKFSYNSLLPCFDTKLDIHVSLLVFDDIHEWQTSLELYKQLSACPTIIGLLDSFASRREATQVGCFVFERVEHLLPHALGNIQGKQSVRQITASVAQTLLHLHQHKYLALNNLELSSFGLVADTWKLVDWKNIRAISNPFRLASVDVTKLPPECSKSILDENYEISAQLSFDMWWFGLLLFHLLARQPFFSDNQQHNALAVLKWFMNEEEDQLKSAIIETISDHTLKLLLSHMLVKDVRQRWNIQQVADYLKGTRLSSTIKQSAVKNDTQILAFPALSDSDSEYSPICISSKQMLQKIIKVGADSAEMNKYCFLVFDKHCIV